MEWLKKNINNSKTQKGAVRNLKETSLNAYIRTLQKLHEKMFDTKQFDNLDWLDDYDDVKENITKYVDSKNNEKTLSVSSQKTTLASIVVALSTEYAYDDALLKSYQNDMLELQKDYEKGEANQLKTEKQKENWVSLKRLYDVIKEYKKYIDKNEIMKKTNKTITNKEFNILQRWVVANLYLGSNNHPPNRLDYVMEIINKKDYNELTTEKKNTTNYLVITGKNKKAFSFGEYKSSRTYGLKSEPLDTKLNKVMNIWLAYNKGRSLLYNAKKEPINENGLSKLIMKTFEPSGKKVSASMLRHIYITEKVKQPSIKEKQALADKMKHSVSTQELYIKKD